MVLVAISMTAIIGFAAMAVDLSEWYAQRRLTQSIADSAAIGGTYADMEGADHSGVIAAALSDAVRSGYEDVADNQLVVDPDLPLPSGTIAIPRVDVVVRRKVSLSFSRLFLPEGSVMIAAHAVGGYRGLGPICVIALDESADASLSFSGSTTANMDCGVVSDSSSDSALYIAGSAELVANPAQAHGDIDISGSGELISALPPLPHMPRVGDPYGDLVFPPTPAGCDSGAINDGPSDVTNLDAGGGSYTICGDLNIQGTLNLAPGTYYVKAGDITFNSHATVTGTDVTIVLTADDPNNTGDIRINGGATIDLSAPDVDSGPFGGIVIYKDRDAPASGVNRLNGGVTMNLLGVVYIPSQHVEWSGGADADGCTQIIGRTVAFTGNSYIRNTASACNDIGLVPSGGTLQRQVVLIQ